MYIYDDNTNNAIIKNHQTSTSSQTPQQKKMPSSPTSPSSFSLPLPYRLFFLTIEPISALIGAYYAHFLPQSYLYLTHAASSPLDLSTSTTSTNTAHHGAGAAAAAVVPLSTTIVLSQLANLYLLFAINEALVLRCTTDVRVWKRLLFGLLVADLGHLWSVRGLGGSIYWDVLSWNKMAWGNVGFVYFGATMRICFLLGVGMGGRQRAVKGKLQQKKTS